MEGILTPSTSLPSLPNLNFRSSRRLSLRLSTSNRSEIRGISSSNQFIGFSSPPLFTLRTSHGIRPEPKASGFRCSASADTSAFASDSSPSELPAKFLGVEVSTLKKVIPLGLMFFCILFNYTILRDTKDVLVVTAKGSSAETIPFLKTWVNLPAAIGFMIVYNQLSNVLSKEALFYACMFPFIAFFGLFAFVLYPNVNVIHPTALADRLLEILGPSFLGPIALLRIWSFCIFYVMSELWGSVVVSLLFWGYANQITTVDEASQFYPLFGLGANVALVFSGRTVKYFSNLRKNLGPGVDGWALSVKGMMSIVVSLGILICGIYWGMNRYIKTESGRKKKKKEKTKMGTVESMKFLLSSRYIRDLATLVVAYGISINLVEITWKSKLKAQFPTPNEYSSFMGDFSSCTGIATFTMMLLSRFIFRKFGWGVAAAITPTVLLVTGIAFFSLVLFSDPLGPLFGTLGLTPLLAAVYVGAVQNIFSKSAKYSLFDPCKEMAYIPLDEDTKVKGKAAIDVVCNPLGKSGGALIQQFLILTFGSLSNSTPYLGGILLIIVLAWLAAARSLDLQFTPMVKKDLKDKLIEGKISAVNTRLTGKLEPKQGIRYRFISTLNRMGFIEGKYVPVVEDVSSSGGIQHLTVTKLDTKNQFEQPVATAIKSSGTEDDNHDGSGQHLTVTKLDRKNQFEEPVATAIKSSGTEDHNQDGSGHVSPESPSENEIPSNSS